MSTKVAFETKAGVSEVGVTVPGHGTVRIKEGTPHTATTPEEIAALDAAEGVKRADKASRSSSKSSTTKKEDK